MDSNKYFFLSLSSQIRRLETAKMLEEFREEIEKKVKKYPFGYSMIYDDKYFKSKKQKKVYKKKCEKCGKEFEARSANGKYCSKECRRVWRYNKKKPCNCCGTYYYPSARAQKYCSNECKHKEIKNGNGLPKGWRRNK